MLKYFKLLAKMKAFYFFKDKFSKKFILVISLSLISGLAIAQNFIQISPEEALEIGVKIWYNESADKVSGLTSWGQGENFASLGIGHFIWYPYGESHPFSESFPALIKYMQMHGVIVPVWLQGDTFPACPWNTRAEFIAAQDTPAMRELRQFLLSTIPIQAEFMVYRMENALPKMLESVPPQDRPSNTILLPQLTPHSLGALLALYEHKIFVQSVIWNINCFDQWGVELGKELAANILEDIQNHQISEKDVSTQGLLQRYRATLFTDD